MFSKRFEYSLDDVYGIGEVPPENCPTYIIRKVHNEFEYTIKHENQHIVVFGASRQGKSWMVERYCPEFIRVGCDSKGSRETLFRAILSELGISIASIRQSFSTNGGTEIQVQGKGQAGLPMVAKAELQGSAKGSLKYTKGHETENINIDITNQSEVIRAIKSSIGNRFIVIENFHYLSPEVQKSFASSLREFLYHNIRVIIVGIWKEATKLNTMVSDLTNRIEYIDIGNWTQKELLEIVKKGDNALNVKTNEEIIELFLSHCGYNVGIFKSIMKNFCKLSGIFKTAEKRLELNNYDLAKQALDKSYTEVCIPALERLHKLATSKKSGAKGLRYYIIRSILDNMDNLDISELINGIPFNTIVTTINEYNEEDFQPSNIKQELMLLHLRDESVKNEGSNLANFVPLFYFDQGKEMVFLVESALLAAKGRGEHFSKILGPKERYVRQK